MLMKRDTTLVEALEKHAKDIPEKPAIIFHDTRITYQELNETANRIASSFLELGVQKGDRVALMLPKIPELVIGFLAAVKSHGIAVPINYELIDGDISAILRRITPKCLVTHGPLLDLAARSVPDGVSIPIIAVGDSNERRLAWNEALQRGSPKNGELAINAGDVAYLNYTSGSTGNSKGAVTTHANIYWNTLASVDALGLTRNDVHLCMFAPFAHPHEIFARPLYLGGTMVLLDKIYPKTLAEAISHHKVTCMMGLAPIYENLLEVIEHKGYDVSSLRIPESGGMYTRKELIDRFKKKLGVPILPVWGSTETTGIALANRPGARIPPDSVGKPCATYEVKVVDDSGNELPAGEIGEMIFHGPAVVQGYYHSTAESSACFHDGWYYSGDLGKKDEEGNFYFMERKSGMMKVAGLKVYPQEIERALLNHPGIQEVAVISVKDRLRGEVPKAMIVTRSGRALTEKEVLRFCRERLAHYKLPKIIEIRESLPKTGSGKINKKALHLEHV